MAFAPLAVSAAVPASLSLVETADLGTELPYSPNGAILFDVPGVGTFGISPQFVDAESGTWSTPEVTKKFEPADGREVSGTLSLKWKNGATMDFNIKASLGKQDLKMESSWTVSSDAQGMVRVDLLIPPGIADTLKIGGGGETLIADGKANPNTGMGLPGPLRVTDESGGKELFTIEGSFLASAFPIAGKGITLRLSSYTSGKPTIAESNGLNWTIVFP